MNLNISNQIKNFTSRLQSDTDLLSYEGLIKKKNRFNAFIAREYKREPIFRDSLLGGGNSKPWRT